MVPDIGNHSGTHSGLLSGVGDNEKKRLIKYYKADLIYEYAKRINSNIGDILKKKIDDYLNDKSLDGCNSIIIYNNGNLSLLVNISPQEETVWLTVNQIAALYETTTNNVYMHIQNIIDEGELEIATGKKSLLVGQLHKFSPFRETKVEEKL